jgi:hypothetical protein
VRGGQRAITAIANRDRNPDATAHHNRIIAIANHRAPLTAIVRGAIIAIATRRADANRAPQSRTTIASSRSQIIAHH